MALLTEGDPERPLGGEVHFGAKGSADGGTLLQVFINESAWLRY
jgi:hypothetical protein